MMFYEKTHTLFIFQSRPISYFIQKYGGSNDITILRRVGVRLTPVRSSDSSSFRVYNFRLFVRSVEKKKKEERETRWRIIRRR